MEYPGVTFMGALLSAGDPPEATAMGALLTDLGTIVTDIIENVGTIASTIVDTPLLLLTTGFLFIGGCIGIFGRLLSKN